MSAEAHPHALRGGARERLLPPGLDGLAIGAALALLGLGLVMVTSASIGMADRELGDPFHYTLRQGLRIALGIAVAAAALRVPLRLWEWAAAPLVLAAILLLALVLVPGVGKTVNGSTRWLDLGVFTFQVSELVKLCLIVYLAGYLVRRSQEVRETALGFLRPVALLMLVGVLLLLEPDFGAAAVIVLTGLGLLFLGGVRLWQFSALLAAALGALALLAAASPYRMERITSFLNPWADPFDSGFQLTQSLIAIGSGGWWGVGLGASVQKLFYLPEAHTDFLFAVLAEELGLLGSLAVIGLYAVLVWRAFAIGAASEREGRPFGAYLAYGIGLLIGMQAFVNLGVNMGVLPTKGLTLPLMSYGGNSIVITCLAVGLLLRVERERVLAVRGKGSRR